jgi:hypothetical protein
MNFEGAGERGSSAAEQTGGGNLRTLQQIESRETSAKLVPKAAFVDGGD